ncbi:MAG: hypothetical protein ABIO72_04080 [Patescibacteria group bacterium]
MHLPTDLQPHVAHPTLFVVADHIVAKIYLAGGDAIEDIDALAEPRDTNEHDDSTSSSDGIRTADPHADQDDTPRLKKLLTHLVEHVEAHIKKYDVANLHLVMPADMLHLFKDMCSKQTSEIVRSETHGIFVKDDIMKVMKKIFA